VTTTATTATPTVYHLRAVTDALAAKTHLGAAEKGSVTFCGVRLLMKGDERFGARYKNGPGFTATTDLATIDCGACKRGAAWKGAKGGKYTTTAKAGNAGKASQ
jgi:hypothetical protein